MQNLKRKTIDGHISVVTDTDNGAGIVATNLAFKLTGITTVLVRF